MGTRMSSAVCVVALTCLISPGSAVAEKSVVDVDYVFPSGGSRAPFVLSGGGTVELELATTDPGMAPLSRVGEPGALTPGASLSFTGMTQATIDGGFIYKPPDTHLAVGTGIGAAGRLVHVTNRGIQIFDKAGTSVAAALDLDAYLTGLGVTGLSTIGAANLSFDPKVLFDQHSGRFFVVILDSRTPGVRSNVHICTSKTATPGTLTTTDWTVESASALTSYGGTNTWFDYPSIGADATRLVVTGNMFDAGGTHLGTKVRVFLKSTLTDDGVPPGVTSNDIDVSNTGTYFTAQPAHVFGSTLNGDFYMINRTGSTSYQLWQITGAGGAAALVPGSPSSHAWIGGAFLSAGAPQTSNGTGALPTISTLSSRIQNAVYRDDSIWLALASDSDADSQTEVVWFEIDPNTANSAVAGTQTTPTIVQSGSIDGSTASDWTFMPSIMVNSSGHAVINYSESNSTKAVDMRVVARQSGDALGTFQAPVVLDTGAGEYDDFNADEPERWGDYSGCVVDPDDDETIWVANELCNTAASATGNDATWKTTIAKLGPVPVELMSFSIE